MAVTAKMKVSRVTPNVAGEGTAEVELVPDYAGGRNAEWAAATPVAVYRMTIGNPKALEQFQQGAAFTVTFELEQE